MLRGGAGERGHPGDARADLSETGPSEPALHGGAAGAVGIELNS